MILANGDSWSECAYLKNPQSAWPNQLGQMINEPVVNLSFGGSSNDRIFRTTTEELYKSTPNYLIIGWSNIDRIELTLSNGDHVRCLPWQSVVDDQFYSLELNTLTISESEIHKFYTKHLLNPLLNLKKLFHYILILQDICKLKNIRFVNFFAINDNYFNEIKKDSDRFTRLIIDNYPADKRLLEDNPVIVNQIKQEIFNLYNQIDASIWLRPDWLSMEILTRKFPKESTGHTTELGQLFWANQIKEFLSIDK